MITIDFGSNSEYLREEIAKIRQEFSFLLDVIVTVRELLYSSMLRIHEMQRYEI